MQCNVYIYITLTNTWHLCSLIVPPTVMAVYDNVNGILNTNVMLNFTLIGGVPSPSLNDITVIFNDSTVQAGGRFELKWKENLFTISINSLTLDDEGVYRVIVETMAGNDTAEASLTVYGEKNDCRLCVRSAWPMFSSLAA